MPVLFEIPSTGDPTQLSISKEGERTVIQLNLGNLGGLETGYQAVPSESDRSIGTGFAVFDSPWSILGAEGRTPGPAVSNLVVAAQATGAKRLTGLSTRDDWYASSLGGMKAPSGRKGKWVSLAIGLGAAGALLALTLPADDHSLRAAPLGNPPSRETAPVAIMEPPVTGTQPPAIETEPPTSPTAPNTPVVPTRPELPVTPYVPTRPEVPKRPDPPATPFVPVHPIHPSHPGDPSHPSDPPEQPVLPQPVALSYEPHETPREVAEPNVLGLFCAAAFAFLVAARPRRH